MPKTFTQIVDTDKARLPQTNRPLPLPPSPAAKIPTTQGGLPLSRGFSPVILSSGDTTLVSGALAVPDHGRLQPLERSAMFLDEIHFSVRYANGDATWPIRFSLVSGRHALTNGFVPLSAVDYYWFSETLRSIIPLTGTDFSGFRYTAVRWKLPKPLYVPAGQVVHCQLMLSPFDNSASSAFVDVTYIGRLLPVDFPVPAEIDVPYVTSVYSPDSNVAFIYSKDLQLGNPFDVVMKAQRLTGRYFKARDHSNLPAFIEATTSAAVSLRATLQNQSVVVVSTTGFAVPFDGMLVSSIPGHMVLNLFGMDLYPKDRFDVEITGIPTDTDGSLNSPVASVGLVAWRREVL